MNSARSGDPERKINGDVKKFSHRHPRLNEFFFDSIRKRMSVVHEYEGEQWVFSKGSAGGYNELAKWKIVDNEIVTLTDADKKIIKGMNNEKTRNGKRSSSVEAPTTK